MAGDNDESESNHQLIQKNREIAALLWQGALRKMESPLYFLRIAEVEATNIVTERTLGG